MAGYPASAQPTDMFRYLKARPVDGDELKVCRSVVRCLCGAGIFLPHEVLLVSAVESQPTKKP
jgi:hypothetical protein